MSHEKSTLDHNDQGQVLLTYELLFLLQWMVEHDAEALKKIIVKALKNGFNAPDFRSNEVIEMHISDPAVHESIIDFLGLLDSLLLEATTELDMQKNAELTLIPALKQIDSTVCADDVVQSSLKKTNAQLHSNANQNAQEILLKELLRRWKPDKKILSS
jgi:hypothetical protein